MDPLNRLAAGRSYQRTFGPVRVGWTVTELPRLNVEVWWEPAGKILDAWLDAARISAPFSAQMPGDPNARVSGSLEFQPPSRTLVLSLDCPPEFNFQRLALQPLPPPPPSPHPPPPPTPEPIDEFDEVEPLDELFPYMHLHAWPRPAPTALAVNFVGNALPVDDFSKALAEARASANPRPAMRALALAFLDDADPWTGLFARDASALEGLAGRLAGLANELRDAPPPDAEALVMRFERCLGEPWSEITAQASQPIFAVQLARAWQTFFALNIVLGDDLPGLSEMSDTLVVAGALQALPAEAPWPDWSPETLAAMLRSHLRLPANIFPVPPVNTLVQPGAQPYAIGELRRVRRRLRCYRLGAVAHIENVMASERKLTARNERLSEREENNIRVGELTESDTARQARALSIESAAEQALSEAWQLDYSKTYGPAQPGTETGNRRLNIADASKPPATLPEMRKTVDNDRRAGRALMQQALRRYASEVARERQHVLKRDAETRREQCLDRRGAESHLRGVYRWVDLVYECREEHCGRRLLVELVLTRPGASFTAQVRAEGGPALAPPPTLESLGVRSLDDVSADPRSPTFFATLAAALGVADVTPPPAATLAVAQLVRQAEPALDVPLPPGYLAREGTLTLLSADATLKATCAVGTLVQAVVANTPATTTGLGGLATSVPVAVAVAAGGQAASWQLAVGVQADASPALMQDWKAEVYARLAQAAVLADRDWRARITASGGRSIAANPQAIREAIRRALRRQALARCVAWGQAQTGTDDATDRWLPALLSWLEHAVEWDELSYQLVEDPLAPGTAPVFVDSGDPRLAAFVEAAFARVLVPVRPGREFALVYFLASGLCWPSAEWAVPAFDAPIAPVATRAIDPPRWIDVSLAVTQAATTPPEPERPSAGWRELVPSAMTVLQDTGDLPSFDAK